MALFLVNEREGGDYLRGCGLWRCGVVRASSEDEARRLLGAGQHARVVRLEEHGEPGPVWVDPDEG